MKETFFAEIAQEGSGWFQTPKGRFCCSFHSSATRYFVICWADGAKFYVDVLVSCLCFSVAAPETGRIDLLYQEMKGV
jgi:hypothetical protein